MRAKQGDPMILLQQVYRQQYVLTIALRMGDFRVCDSGTDLFSDFRGMLGKRDSCLQPAIIRQGKGSQSVIAEQLYAILFKIVMI